MPYYHLSESVISLDELRRQRLQSNRISHRADLLVQRHEEGAEESLSEFAPLTLFADTDCLLFLRAQVQTDPVPEWPRWMPWSSLYLRQPPRYLHEARQTRYAQHLLRVFNISDIVTLRERLAACPAVLSRGWGAGPFRVWHNPLAGFDFNTIGSR
jgi:hypothetical protein